MSTTFSICSVCGQRSTSHCSRCKLASYCSAACQKAAWPSHKLRCSDRSRNPAAAATPVGAGADAAAKEEWLRRQVQTPEERARTQAVGGIARAQQAMMAARAAALEAALLGRFTARKVSGPRRGAIVESARDELGDGERIVIEWGPPGEAGAERLERAADAAAAQAERSTPRRVEINFLAPGSLAAELHSAGSGVADDFKIVRGGPLYLVGAPDLFWSMALHLLDTRGATCLPPQAPASPRADWSAAYGLREIDAHARAMAKGAAAGGLARGGTLTLNSESLAAVHLLRGVAAMRKSLAAGAGGMDARNVEELHPMRAGEPIPCSEAEIPPWWAAVRALWDGVFRRSLIGEGAARAVRPPCMFYLTAAGCANGEGRCGGAHDQEYGAAVSGLVTKRFGSLG